MSATADFGREFDGVVREVEAEAGTDPEKLARALARRLEACGRVRRNDSRPALQLLALDGVFTARAAGLLLAGADVTAVEELAAAVCGSTEKA